MSSFYSDASLVMIPSGYKTSKVYSAVPTDGLGDLVFSRSNDTATRVGPDGLIEKVRTNLVLQSVWPNIGTGVAPTSWSASFLNFSAGPLAGQLLCNTSASRGFITQSVSLTAGQYALSVFVDTVTISNPVISLITIFGSTDVKFYEDGIEVISSTNIVAGKRYTTVGTVTTGSFTMRIGSGVTASATANYVISRPQLEVSDFGATPYIPTTTAAVSVGMLANVPRLDYLGGGCPKLLLEPQRQNLTNFSENFDNAFWTKLNSSTITANTSVSPSGFQDADKFQASNLAFGGILRRTITVTSGAAHTLSFFCKKDNYRYVGIRFNTSTLGGTIIPTYDFDTNTFNAQGVTGVTLSSQLYANGWVRVILTFTSTTTTGTSDICIVPANGDTATALTGTESVFIWGAQLEAGSYATSYIPTLAAAVTRSADAASKTGISALIGQTEGTLFVEFNSSNVVGVDNIVFGLSTGSALNRIIIFFGTNINAQIRDAGVVQTTITGPASTANTTFKCALAYNLNDVAFYVNGVLVGTDLSATIPATSNVRFDSGAGAGACDVPISQALVFKTRLTNSQLAELTA